MSNVVRSPEPRGQRRPLRRIAVLTSAIVALLPGAAFAQESAISPDSDQVMIVTAVVSVLALIACAIGYAWRRMQGMDHPTPDELEMMGSHGHDEHEEHASAAAHH
ncbi:MAG: hypothetical protein AB7R89_33540 [Dehalococcoidia bacterium]